MDYTTKDKAWVTAATAAKVGAMSALKHKHANTGNDIYQHAKAFVATGGKTEGLDTKGIGDAALSGAWIGLLEQFPQLHNMTDNQVADAFRAARRGADAEIRIASNANTYQSAKRNHLDILSLDSIVTDDDGKTDAISANTPGNTDAIAIALDTVYADAIKAKLADMLGGTMTRDYQVWESYTRDGYKYTEIVEIYGISAANARKIVSRANEKLGEIKRQESNRAPGERRARNVAKKLTAEEYAAIRAKKAALIAQNYASRAADIAAAAAYDAKAAEKAAAEAAHKRARRAAMSAAEKAATAAVKAAREESRRIFAKYRDDSARYRLIEDAAQTAYWDVLADMGRKADAQRAAQIVRKSLVNIW